MNDLTLQKAQQWLEENAKNLPIFAVLLRAAYEGEIDVMKLLHEQGLTTQEYYRENGNAILQEAALGAKYAGVAVLEWLRQLGVATPKDCQVNNHKVLRIGLMFNNIPLLEWLQQQKAVTPEDCKTCEGVFTATEFNNVETLEWLRQQNAVTSEDWRTENYEMLGCAFRLGRINVIEWALQHDMITLDDCRACEAVNWAAQGNRVTTFKWLWQHNLATLEILEAAKTLQIAAMYGSIEVLDWLLQIGVTTPENCRINRRTILYPALLSENIFVINWLWEHNAVELGDCRAAVRFSVINKKIRSVKFLLRLTGYDLELVCYAQMVAIIYNVPDVRDAIVVAYSNAN